jgi:arginine exporter protein ArgO
MSTIDYMQITEIAGLIILTTLGFYALRLLGSFRTGVLARSWRYISVGAILLIFAQIPLIAEGIGSFIAYVPSLAILAMGLRFLGVVFLIIGMRIQSSVWQTETKTLPHESSASSPIER